MDIEWSSQLATGEPRVDQQHRELLERLNALLAAARTGTAKSEIEAMLSFLSGYVHTHFTYEEGCMERLNCPVHETNKRAHAKFTADFAEIRKRFDDEGVTLSFSIEIRTKLIEWLINHIGVIDKQLGPCVARTKN